MNKTKHVNNTVMKPEVPDDFDRPTSDTVIYEPKKVSVGHIAQLSIFYAGLMASFNNIKRELDKFPPAKTCLEYRPELYPIVLNELRKNAITGLFHLWLRNLQDYFAMGGNAVNTNKYKILTTGYEYMLWLFKDITALQLCIPTLEKYGCLTNAIKHGKGPSFDKLECFYTEFFCEPTEYVTSDKKWGLDDVSIVNSPFVTQEHIEELFNATIDFWNNVPERLSINVQQKLNEWRK